MCLLLTGCANFLAVRRELGPDDSVRYKLGSLPLFGEQQVYDDFCGSPRQLAAQWSKALAETGTLSAEQSAQWQQAICEQDLEAISRVSTPLTPDQVSVLRQSLHRLDPYYTVETIRDLETWAKWAIAGAVLSVLGLSISAERTGFFEPGDGRYQNRRRAIGKDGGGSGCPPICAPPI